MKVFWTFFFFFFMSTSDSENEDISNQNEQIISKKQEFNFSSSISRILEQGSDARPILSLKRSIEKSIDDEKLMQKARKVLKQEKHLKELRIKPTLNEHEKILKKVATRGVVQLFNALKQAQKINETNKEPEKVTKQVFLEQIKQAEQVPFLKKDYLLSEKSFE